MMTKRSSAVSYTELSGTVRSRQPKNCNMPTFISPPVAGSCEALPAGPPGNVRHIQDRDHWCKCRLAQRELAPPSRDCPGAGLPAPRRRSHTAPQQGRGHMELRGAVALVT